ncbi:MAG: DinB family protein [Rhodothermales bacterium]
MLDGLKPVAEQLAFNASLFDLAIGDLTSAEARVQYVEGVPTIHWLAAHLVTARHHMLHLLRKSTSLPWEGRYETSVDVALQESVTNERIVAEWNRVSPVLLSVLATADQKLLRTAPPSPFPTVEQTTQAAVAFLANHEAYHIGQISLLRRAAGKMPLVETLLAQ